MSTSAYYKLWGWLTAAFTLGLIAGFICRERSVSSERLFDQSLRLTKICRDAMVHHALPERIAERVTADLDLAAPLEYNPANGSETGCIVVPPESGIFGMGGRWIVYIRLGRMGRCDRAYLEMQPTGWP